MTIESAPPKPAQTAASFPRPVALQWRSPERNLWVGRGAGRRRAGTVVRIGAEYVGTDAQGERVGVFTSLEDAESALVTLAALATSRPEGPARARVMAIVAAASGTAALGMAVLGVLVLGH